MHLYYKALILTVVYNYLVIVSISILKFAYSHAWTEEKQINSSSTFIFTSVPPTLTKRCLLESERRSLNVSWTAWDERDDMGEGPIIGYKVYWKLASKQWTSASESHQTSQLRYTITSLIPNTQYDVAVVAIRPGLGGEGKRSPICSSFTQCAGNSL